MDKRPTGIRCKGEPSKGRINPRLETIGQKTGERKEAKQTRARRARRRAHADGVQHGTRPQHGAHGAVRIQGSYSTARCPTAPELLTYHSTARTAQCAPRGATTGHSTPWYLQHGAHGAHGARSAHGAGRTPGSYSSAGCASVKRPMHAQDKAHQSTKQLGHGRNTQGPEAHKAHQHENSALSAGQ